MKLISLLFFFIKKLLRVTIIFAFVVLAITLLIWLIHTVVTVQYQSAIYTNIHSISGKKVALVLGAGLHADGSPSDILADRLSAAALLYQQKKIRRIIVSGDNRFHNYSEPDTMKKVLIDKGVAAEDIYPDYAGRRTYDSCWRVKSIFSQTDIILVTQSFHMTRSLFLCNNLGVKSIGFIADKPRYRWDQWLVWTVRDYFSLLLSIVDVILKRPSTIGGNKINIS